MILVIFVMLIQESHNVCWMNTRKRFNLKITVRQKFYIIYFLTHYWSTTWMDSCHLNIKTILLEVVHIIQHHCKEQRRQNELKRVSR